jgi:hypothetical protein
MYSSFIATRNLYMNQLKQPSCLAAVLVGAVLANSALAANDPIISADWFPMVNGAILYYKNDAVVSSTAARVTVTANKTFGDVAGTSFRWALDVTCDVTAGKENWNAVPTKSFARCFDYSRYFNASAGGVSSVGDDRFITEYGFALAEGGNLPTYLRQSIYSGPQPTIVLKDGAVPGTYQNIPTVGNVLSGQSGALWQNNAVVTSTHTTTFIPTRTASNVESFREVGTYAATTTYAGAFATLYVEDAVLDVNGAFAPTQLRRQTWHYAKGIGPVIIQTGDFMTAAANDPSFKPNTPDGKMVETFVLQRHNLRGCPGYDATLPPLPPNSGNVCAKFYSTAGLTKTMVEYRYAPLDYYFVTSRESDKAALDGLAGWARTGKSFNVLENNDAGSKGITRFYFDRVAKGKTRGSHFYSLLDSDVAALNAQNPNKLTSPGLPQNEGIDSYAYLPSNGGTPQAACAAGFVPVYRLFRSAFDDPNHRFVADKAIYDQFVAAGWSGEGIAMCTPQ